MMYGYDTCQRARDAASAAKDFASSMRAASIQCPEAIERNASFLREQINEAREALAAAESKLPKPKEVKDVQRTAA